MPVSSAAAHRDRRHPVRHRVSEAQRVVGQRVDVRRVGVAVVEEVVVGVDRVRAQAVGDDQHDVRPALARAAGPPPAAAMPASGPSAASPAAPPPAPSRPRRVMPAAAGTVGGASMRSSAHHAEVLLELRAACRRPRSRAPPTARRASPGCRTPRRRRPPGPRAGRTALFSCPRCRRSSATRGRRRSRSPGSRRCSRAAASGLCRRRSRRGPRPPSGPGARTP